jgi:acetyl esterase
VTVILAVTAFLYIEEKLKGSYTQPMNKRTVSRERSAKTAGRMRRMAELVYRFRGIIPAKAGKERLVNTSRGNIRVLEYGFDAGGMDPLFIDMHGGGFVLMSADVDERMNLNMRERTGVKVISIDYPKAPENPFPAAVEAVYEVILHYAEQGAAYGLDRERLGIGGHSAGANLATVTCMRAAAKGDLRFKYQILDYPPLDLHTDPFLKPTPKKSIPPKMASMFNACYIDPDNARDPFVSPVFAAKEQLVGLPPALVITAGLDSLHDEGALYARLLGEAGVAVETHDFENAPHGFTYEQSADADRACALMADFIRRHSG